MSGKGIGAPKNEVIDTIRGYEGADEWNKRNEGRTRKDEASDFAKQCNLLLPAGATVVEVGIGAYGTDTRFFARENKNVIGIDISDLALKNTREAADEEKLPVHLIQANERFLPIAQEQKLDAVYARSSLYLTDSELEQFLLDLTKSIKPGGYIMIEGKSLEDETIKASQDLGGGLSVDEKHHLRRVWTDEGIRSLLKKVNLELVFNVIGHRKVEEADVKDGDGKMSTYLNFIARVPAVTDEKE